MTATGNSEKNHPGAVGYHVTQAQAGQSAFNWVPVEWEHARMIHGLRSSNHITDALVNLHWLRIPGCITLRSQSSCTKCFMDSRRSISDHWLACPTYLVNVHSVWPAQISWTYHLFDCRLSDIQRFWPANLKQSASSCDLSRDSYHVQSSD